MKDLILLIAVLGAMYAGLNIILKQKEKRKQGGKYWKKKTFLTPAEQKFYEALRQTIQPGEHILAKVRLEDLVGTGPMDRNRVSQKHVDFVICRTEDLTPLLAIELDDSSHQSEKARSRDLVKNEALRQAKIPLCRHSVRRNYSPSQLRKLFDPIIRPCNEEAIKKGLASLTSEGLNPGPIQ